MGFPVSCAGLLPGLLMSAAISMAALKELCISVLKPFGLVHLQSETMAFFDDEDEEEDVDQLTDLQHDFVGLYHIANWTRNCPLPHIYDNLEYNDHPSSNPISDLSPILNNGVIFGNGVDDDEYTPLGHFDKNNDQGDELESIDSSPYCCVCLCPLVKNPNSHPSFDICRLTKCGHSFHNHCIASWLRHGHSICPLCRAPLS